MLINSKNLDESIEAILEAPVIALDTETSGLRIWQQDRMFACIIATADEVYYFDDVTRLKPVFDDPRKRIYMLNAKFDMAVLYRAGLTNITTPTILDVMVLARLLQNDLVSAGMGALAPWVGMEKGDVEEWAKAHGAWVWTDVVDEETGEITQKKVIRYDMVPVSVMQPYAENDARITFALGEFILTKLKERDDTRHASQPSILGVLNTEMEVTKVLFEMERTGAVLDLAYTKAALDYERERYQECRREFKIATGVDYVNSSKVLGECFTRLSPEDAPKFKATPTGKFATSDDVISTFSSPLAQVVQRQRDAYKRAGTYFSNYLDLVDETGRIHASFNQCVRTGRMSCRSPNLQNIQKGADTESQYPVRKCFIAPEGHLFASLDYAQIEYRLMLEYSGEQAVIDKILNHGLDVHAATAEMMGVDRHHAKTIGFMLLYGGGVQKLADALHIPLSEAKELKSLYFSRLPRTGQLISAVIRQAETQGYVFNWAGRILRCADPKLSYAMPNHLIQSGAADIMKRALVGVHAYLQVEPAKLIMVVHDELDLYIPDGRFDIVEKIITIMKEAYPHRHLPMDVSAAWGKNWAELGEE